MNATPSFYQGVAPSRAKAGAERSGRRTTDAWPWVGCTCVVIAARFVVADAQLDWDEELYWQIAYAWKADRLPYADIFDHKSPLVYVLQLLYSGFSGELWLFRSVCTLLLTASAAGFGAAMWPGRRDLAAAFTFLVVLTQSGFQCLGANTEILYAPYVLLAGALLLRGAWVSAAISAAVAVNLKYTVALDIAGLALFVLLSHRISRRSMFSFVVAFATLAVVIWLSFYVYFRSHGVDLVETTITVNLHHAVTDRRPLLEALGSYAVTRFMIVAAALVLLMFLTGERSDRQSAWGLVLWTAASLLQACVTGKTYYHYFTPVYLPMCALLVARWEPGVIIRWRRSSLALGATLALVLLVMGIERHHEFGIRRKRLKADICEQLRGRSVYVADELLATYRICDLEPGKFMFPPFVFRPHFVRLAGSRGMLELDEFELVLISPGSRFASVVRTARKSGIVTF